MRARGLIAGGFLVAAVSMPPATSTIAAQGGAAPASAPTFAKDVAPIGFWTYLRAGLPITLATLAFAVVLLLAVARFTPLLG